MNDLTDKWKKGELPNGYYWIQLSWGGMVIMAYHTAFDGLFELDDHYYDEDELSEVLAPVPSFKEWQAKLEENAQLKELLKECKEVMSTGGYIFATVKQVKRARKLLENIEEVLK